MNSFKNAIMERRKSEKHGEPNSPIKLPSKMVKTKSGNSIKSGQEFTKISF